jgi:hypothetical protein
MQFYIGTCLLKGLLYSTDFAHAGNVEKMDGIGKESFDLFGSGNLIKIKIFGGPERSGWNLYRQIILKELKVFGVCQGFDEYEKRYGRGKSTGWINGDQDHLQWRLAKGLANYQNQERSLKKARIDRVLIENGFNVLKKDKKSEIRKEMIREWWDDKGLSVNLQKKDSEVDEVFYELDMYRIDRLCKDLIEYLERLKRQYLGKEEFQNVKVLNEKIKKVQFWGREIFRLQILLENAILQERFGYAETLKKRILELRELKFKIDVMYESPFFLEMIRLEDNQNKYRSAINKEKENIKKIQEPIQSKSQTIPIQKIIKPAPKIKKKSTQKVIFKNVKKQKKSGMKVIEVPEKEKIFNKRSNNIMDSILQREINKLGGRSDNYMDWIQVETLRMLHEKGILKVMRGK